jgi:peptide subunit release factor 1 (eRF1)
MITRAQLDQLQQFQGGDYLITSCYLDLDRAKRPPQMLKIRTKDLLQSAHQQLAAKAGSHAQRQSVRDDVARIETQATQEILAGRHKGLAVFSCSAHKFWQVYGLPRLTRDILVADRVPYIRPLSAILAEYHRFCAVLVDSMAGQVFEVYMGEIIEHADVVDAVPRRVKEGGFGGRDERKLERHHAQAVHQHFQRLADATFKLFKRDRFDYLILGGLNELLSGFQPHLHPDLQNRVVGRFHAKPFATPPDEVLARALEIEDRVERERERRMADELVQKAGAGNRAVSGVSATLNAIARGEAQTLLVEEGFESPGYVCYGCRHVSLDEGQCPNCRIPFEPCPDIVDEAIELALSKNCQIQHLHGPTALRDAGRMGALLRYQA